MERPSRRDKDAPKASDGPIDIVAREMDRVAAGRGPFSMSTDGPTVPSCLERLKKKISHHGTVAPTRTASQGDSGDGTVLPSLDERDIRRSERSW